MSEITPTTEARTPGPVVVSDMLREQLLTWRTAAGMSLQDAVDAMGGDVAKSTLSRAENGLMRNPEPELVHNVLRMYGASEEQTEVAVLLARTTGANPTAEDVYPYISPTLREYADYEAYAQTIWGYYGHFVPDISWNTVITPKRLDIQTTVAEQQLRRNRLEYLTSLSAPAQHIIVGDFALRQAVATPGFRVEPLIQMAQAPHITLQIIDNEAVGVHPLYKHISSARLTFANSTPEPRLYALAREKQSSDMAMIRQPEEVLQQFSEAFMSTVELAASPESTIDRLSKMHDQSRRH